MASAEFGWESLLHTDAPQGCSLKAALFTTYDRADDRLLVEYLLPLLLKLSREPDGEGAERQYFLLELDGRLKRLHDRLLVVSSTAREEPGDADEEDSGTYGWIWRSIRRLTVGSQSNAVQHSKLWLLHWGAAEEDGAEYLELVVSSANLTRAAFKGQIQAAWRACIELRPQGSAARLNGWGVLPHFLRELATSAGDSGRLTPFVELLARGECPERVTFVASVPGTHSHQVLRRTPWSVAGLRKIADFGRDPLRVSILCPFVGSWEADALTRWCDRIGSSTDRLELVWIDKNHPWAREGRWIMPKATLKRLTKVNSTLLQLYRVPADSDATDPFHEEHRPEDDRWSHAKVYSLKRGSLRRLLVTSANFSTAAWGRQNDDGKLTIENFELGVCTEQNTWPFDNLQPFESEQHAATVSELPSRGSSLIMWAQAVWDGKKVDIDCRCEGDGELAGELNCAGEWSRITTWKVGAESRVRSSHVPWLDSKRPPLFVKLTCEQDTLRVPVFDERPSRDRENTIPSEVDENLAQTMRDELLFEEYGGYVAADAVDVAVTLVTEDGDEGGRSIRPDSYDVPAIVLARRHLGVVDNWANQVKRAAKRRTGEFERGVLQRDGELLIEAFKRQADRDEKKGSAWAIGARLAAEELTLRLKYFPEA
jgi:tyrosyl-DNA phosphodiesterase